jgi:hypothetical protein
MECMCAAVLTAAARVKEEHLAWGERAGLDKKTELLAATTAVKV